MERKYRGSLLKALLKINKKSPVRITSFYKLIDNLLFFIILLLLQNYIPNKKKG